MGLPGQAPGVQLPVLCAGLCLARKVLHFINSCLVCTDGALCPRSRGSLVYPKKHVPTKRVEIASGTSFSSRNVYMLLKFTLLPCSGKSLYVMPRGRNAQGETPNRGPHPTLGGGGGATPAQPWCSCNSASSHVILLNYVPSLELMMVATSSLTALSLTLRPNLVVRSPKQTPQDA